MADWSFLTNHARVLLCIAHDPGVRLRGIAARVGITERSAYGIVTDLAEAGYVVKQKDGRPQPLPDPGAPAAARLRQPGTHHRRSPGAPDRRQRGSDRISRVTLKGVRRARHRHLVTPSKVIAVIAPQLADAGGRPVPAGRSRPTVTAVSGMARCGARRRDVFAGGADRVRLPRAGRPGTHNELPSAASAETADRRGWVTRRI
jgi:hypothetical protein